MKDLRLTTAIAAGIEAIILFYFLCWFIGADDLFNKKWYGFPVGVTVLVMLFAAMICAVASFHVRKLK